MAAFGANASLPGIANGAGRGVPQDTALAHMWYNLPAARGEPISKPSDSQTTP
jgi:hypothetical protein